MGRVLHELEALDRRLQDGPAHPLVGPPSLHASLIDGGRELSSYPDRCRLKLERRTIPGEDDSTVTAEMESLLARLRAADPEFDAAFTLMFSRPPYAIPSDHDLPRALRQAVQALRPLPDGKVPCPLPDSKRSEAPCPLPDIKRSEAPCPLPDSERSESPFVGMSFWTDAAVLGSAGIPSVLFGPGGAGLHSVEEYVEIQDVLRCRDALAALARAW
jgi:acetylornithine deacetylase